MGMCEKLEVTRSYESTSNTFKGVNDGCSCQVKYLQTYPAMAFHQVHTNLW